MYTKECVVCKEVKTNSRWYKGPKCQSCYNKALTASRVPVLGTCSVCKETKLDKHWRNNSTCNACHVRLRQPISARRDYSNKYRATPVGRYRSFLGYAKYNQKESNISFEQYLGLVSRPCHYCGATLGNTGCQLDRLDNSLGYLINNVVPCCTPCNMFKRDYLSADEMCAVVNLLSNLRKKQSPLAA